MKCPYETLGVGRGASPEAINKMYRRLAKRHHPDHNPGDDEAKARYEAVDKAYQILSDPVRRELYDRTGDVSDRKPSPADAQIAELAVTIQEALCAVVIRFASGSGDYKRANLLAEIKAIIQKQLAETEQTLDHVGRHLRVLKEVLEKTEGPAEGNVLADVTKAQISRVESDEKRLRDALDRLTRGRQYLNGLKYKGALDELKAFYPKPGTHYTVTWGT